MRIARSILLRILLGLATSIVLAWALAAWLPHTHLAKRFNLVGDPGAAAGTRTVPPGSGQLISIFEFSRPGMIRRAWRAGYAPSGGAPRLWQLLSPDAAVVLHLKTANHDRSWGDLPTALARPTPTASGDEDARGWPFLCLWCSLDEPAIEATTTSPPVHGGFPLSRPTPKSSTAAFRALPLLPIWRGLFADAAIFTVAWSIAIQAFLLARTFIRTCIGAHRFSRGLCPACGYDLAGNTTGVCPECGTKPPARYTHAMWRRIR